MRSTAPRFSSTSCSSKLLGKRRPLKWCDPPTGPANLRVSGRPNNLRPVWGDGLTERYCIGNVQSMGWWMRTLSSIRWLFAPGFAPGEQGGFMDMKRLRLRDWVIAALGLWMLVSPRVLHFAGGQSSEIWCAWLVGAAILLVTAGSRFVVEIWSPWQDGTNALLGLWLMVAPWALGFAAHMTARTNSIVVGFMVAVLALWTMVVDTDLRKWMGDWMHQHHLLR